jgi:hypothetical protein
MFRGARLRDRPSDRWASSMPGQPCSGGTAHRTGVPRRGQAVLYLSGTRCSPATTHCREKSAMGTPPAGRVPNPPWRIGCDPAARGAPGGSAIRSLGPRTPFTRVFVAEAKVAKEIVSLSLDERVRRQVGLVSKSLLLSLNDPFCPWRFWRHGGSCSSVGVAWRKICASGRVAFSLARPDARVLPKSFRQSSGPRDRGPAPGSDSFR